MSPTQEWLVILPDYPGALERRMAIRPYSYNSKHLEVANESSAAGKITFGGATLDEPIKEGSPPKINGSAMIYVANTKEEVLERVKNDCYYQNDVWDKEKIQIMPFKTAIRTAL